MPAVHPCCHRTGYIYQGKVLVRDLSDGNPSRQDWNVESYEKIRVEGTAIPAHDTVVAEQARQLQFLF